MKVSESRIARGYKGRFMAAVCIATVMAMSTIGGALQAQSTTAPPVAATLVPTVAPALGLVRVSLQTSVGTIILDLDKAHAPITTANFLKYVDQKRLNGTTFYRAMQMAGGTSGLIQGGASGARDRILPPIAHEPTSQTGLSNRDGVITMARNAPGTADADFFICIGDMSGLDARPGLAGDNLGYAAFGHVVEGMDVVKQIFAAPISPTKGVGFMKGQMIAAPIKIISATRVKLTAK